MRLYIRSFDRGSCSALYSTIPLLCCTGLHGTVLCCTIHRKVLNSSTSLRAPGPDLGSYPESEGATIILRTDVGT